MIDTIKIFTKISKEIYYTIYNNSIVKTSYNSATGEVYYNIINDSLKGSYDSSLSVRVVQAIYGFDYVLIIEGSYHKIMQGQNAHNGYYNLYTISQKLIELLEYNYNIKLPDVKHWFVNRIDISICFDLKDNKNVCNYINNINLCRYPRRKFEYHINESVYYPGSTSTLKIYNKYLEFMKHDFKKLNKSNFDVIKFIEDIKGYIRFEIEIKNKRLLKLYNKNKYVRVKEINYRELRDLWSEEFMKLLKFYDNDLNKIHDKMKVEERLIHLFGSKKGNILYSFYLSILVDGLENVKNRVSKTTYYRNINLLKESGIDFSQTYKVDFEKEIVNFNPFTAKEVV